MAEPSFKELEHAGWSQRAGAYDTWFSHITSQANEALLDALGKHLGGARLLDVALAQDIWRLPRPSVVRWRRAFAA